jgi:hypothetical protein
MRLVFKDTERAPAREWVLQGAQENQYVPLRPSAIPTYDLSILRPDLHPGRVPHALPRLVTQPREALDCVHEKGTLLGIGLTASRASMKPAFRVLFLPPGTSLAHSLQANAYAGLPGRVKTRSVRPTEPNENPSSSIKRYLYLFLMSICWHVSSTLEKMLDASPAWASRPWLRPSQGCPQ